MHSKLWVDGTAGCKGIKSCGWMAQPAVRALKLWVDGTAGYMLGTASYMVVAHVIIVSAPVQKIGFLGFSDLL